MSRVECEANLEWFGRRRRSNDCSVKAFFVRGVERDFCARLSGPLILLEVRKPYPEFFYADIFLSLVLSLRLRLQSIYPHISLLGAKSVPRP